MGRTVRFDQVYVANLDAQPVEEEVLSTVKSIITGEIEADEISVTRFGIANTNPSKNFTVGEKVFMDENDTIVVDVKGRSKAERMFVDSQLAVGTTNPTKAFQVTDKVFIDINGRDLLTVNGNTLSGNVIVKDVLSSASINPNVVIKNIASNLVTVRGNTYSHNVSVVHNLDVGPNVHFDGYGANVLSLQGNVQMSQGDFQLTGNLVVFGNVLVSELGEYTLIENLVVANTVIQMGVGNDGSRDMGFIMNENEETKSNLVFGYQGAGTQEFVIGRTNESVEGFASTLSIKDDETVNLHVYGDIYTSNSVGVANVNPIHDLDVGSNLFVHDTGSNVLEVNGFTYTKGLKLGPLGLQVGDAVTLNPAGVADPSAAIINLSGNFQGKGLRTSGETPWNSGIANTNPQDTFAIGTQITSNLESGNTWYVYGNTYTSNLLADFARITGDLRIGGPGTTLDETRYIKSGGQLIIHANDSSGDNDESNALILKSGTRASNVSAIEINSSSFDRDHQSIIFKTKNTERMRITAHGNVAIQNTSPAETVTIAAPVRINYSNTITFGNTWGLANHTSMRMFARPNNGDAFIDVIGASGKGLNFAVSSTGIPGSAKMTIVDSGNVGFGTTQPEGLIQTSGGTIFVNKQVTNNNNFDHTLSPLVVTNRDSISVVNDLKTVTHFCRESTSGFGAKSSIKLGRFEEGGSRTRMDFDLAHDSYDSVNVMTLRSDGKVGVGTHTPTGKLEVRASGGYNPGTNGLLVYNDNDTIPNKDAIMTAQVREDSGDAFSSYVIYDGVNSYTGWAVGTDNKTGDRDFRITNNVYAVSNVYHTALFIDGVSSNVGIGTDQTNAKLHVLGDLQVENDIRFGGVVSDNAGLSHTFLRERQYDETGRSELFIFKGNDSVLQEFAGPDQIRHVAGRHVFQTFTTTTGLDQTELDSILDDNAITDVFNPIPVMQISGNRRVLIAAPNEDQVTTDTKLYVNGEILVPLEQRISTTGMFISSAETGDINVIDNDENRDLVFRENGSERIRFKNYGAVGIGTSTINANVHVYSGHTGDLDMLKLESPGPSSGYGYSAFNIYKTDGYGGHIKGWRERVNNTSGLRIGIQNPVTGDADVMTFTSSSNVGIGTTTPAKTFHIYSPLTSKTVAAQRMEVGADSNVALEFKTDHGVSNIYCTNTGNVHINPTGTHCKIEGDLNITGDITFSGEFELGNRVAINLAGAGANTNLHVNGGVITNTDQVACKRYSRTFSIADGLAKDITLHFTPGAFYAKVKAILRETLTGHHNISTMVLELSGGSSEPDFPCSNAIAIGTKNVFGLSSAFPWDPEVVTTGSKVTIVPYNIDNTRVYSYDVYVKVIGNTVLNGGLERITRDGDTFEVYAYDY